MLFFWFWKKINARQPTTTPRALASMSRSSKDLVADNSCKDSVEMAKRKVVVINLWMETLGSNFNMENVSIVKNEKWKALSMWGTLGIKEGGGSIKIAKVIRNTVSIIISLRLLDVKIDDGNMGKFM